VNGRAPKSHPRSRGRPPQTREERKARTRQKLVDAALGLLADRGFSGLSLREVAREAGVVPGAFYRHFDSMEALGLVLIDESFRALRDMLRGARAEQLETEHVIGRSIDILATNVAAQPLHWQFIARERSSGVTVLRYAIRQEIRLITSELATDLARFPGLSAWTTEDLNVLAGLFVNSMVSIAEAFGDAEDPVAVAEIRRTAEKQLRMIVVGVAGWRSA
jgi:AcrR family transcriptional regulator